MALPKAVWFGVLLLVMFYSLDKRGFRQSVTFFEDLLDSKTSRLHVREKRAVSTNVTDYEIQIVITLFDLERLRMILSNLSFPIPINSTEITNIKTTTVCSSNLTEYQCLCEENFAWSYNNCITYGACDAIISNTCGCINGLPADGQFCQQNTSQTVTTLATPTSTQMNDIVVLEVVLDLRIPVSSAPSNIIDLFRSNLGNIHFPLTISQSLEVQDVNFTTACSPVYDALQCQCENGFAWPCDMCGNNSCSVNKQTCTCINGLPSNDEFCQPITNINTTSGCLIPTTAIPTRPNTTPAPVPVEFDVVLEVRIPVSSVPSDILYLIRTNLGRVHFPLIISQSLEVEQLNFTTACSPVYDALQCQCENGFSWPCDMCGNNSCSVSKQTCTCINGLPSNDEFCQPITNVSPCPTQVIPTPSTTPSPTPVTTTTPSTTTTTPVTTTTLTTTTTTMITPTTTTTTTLKPTTTTTTLKPTTTVSRSDTFTLDLTFNNSYNQESNLVYMNVNTTIVSSCQSIVSMSCSVTYLHFSQGSTIVNYTLSAPSITEIQAIDVKAGVVNTLSKFYSVVFVTGLVFNPPALILNQSLTVTCGPPPSNLSVSDLVSHVWTLNGTTINNDGTHSISTSTKASVLTVSRFLDADNGNYDCKLTFPGSINFEAKGSIKAQLVLPVIQDLLERSKNLSTITLPVLLLDLQQQTTNNIKTIVGSPETITAIVQIFNNVAIFTSSSQVTLNNDTMTNILITTGLLTIDGAKNSWDILNQKDLSMTEKYNNTNIKSVSSLLLSTVENFTTHLVNGPLNIITPFILLNKTTLGNDFIDNLNSSVEIDIPQVNGGNKSITLILFASMNNVLPARNEANSTSEVINGKVTLIKSEADIRNITLTFEITNTTLGNPKCVFWDFTLLDGLGEWSSNGCSMVFTANGTVSCNCNHTTSFSILMSPYSVDDPILDYITYIGVSISIACLILCLIIEGVVWRKIRKNVTSYLRHVSIVNIAVSLLIADIWFLVGAGVSRANPTTPSACTAVTFFIHFFYLSLFFWMLASALLLLYRTLSVFEGGLTKLSMLIIGFSMGYGAPLLIATITIAATAPSNGYIRANNICWLNWNQSKALLAFVIPALLIVLINLIILVVVLYKMLRSRSGRHAPGEKHALIVIARSLAVLTPFFGITWGLGIGTMVAPYDRGILITFSLFNSLQGFFILVFGTLLDKKVLSGLTLSSLSSQGRTTSTSAGSSA